MRLPDGQRLMLLRPHRRERHIQLVSNSDGLARAIDAPGRYNRRMLGSAPEEYDRRRLTVQRFIFKKQKTRARRAKDPKSQTCDNC